MVFKSNFHALAPEPLTVPVPAKAPVKAMIPSGSSSGDTKKQSKKVHHQVKSLIAGSMAGATEISVTYPIDYVKIQLQLDARSSTPRFCGILDCAKQTVEHHGVRGLYRGLNVAVLSPKAIVRFQAFEHLKKHNLDSTGHLSPHAKFLCGLAAGACEAALAVTPIESIKIKFIHDLNFPTQKYEGLFQGISRIIRKQGIKGIYAGLIPTIMKTSTNQAIRFLVVETLKDWKKKGNPRTKVNKPLTALFGAIGGVISVFANTPLDVIKSRMQGLDAHKYKNIVHCAYTIASREGPIAFYKGTLPRLIRVPLETAITFTVYDIVMELLHDVWGH